MREVKQSSAANVMVFMADSTDHITGKTGLTLTITASKDGAAFASITPTVTERGNGWYNLALTASHSDTLGDLVVRATATGADASERVLNVVANVEADTKAVADSILLDTGTDGVALLPADKFSSESGQAQGGAIGNIILRVTASSTNDLFIGQKISIYSGTGAGQTRGISNYNGTTKVATVARNWTVAPDATSMYRVEHDFGPKVDNGLAVTAGTVNDKTAYSISGTKTTLDALNDITSASVWAVGTRTLSSFGTLVADIWSYATRKLTSRNIGVNENIAQEETQITEHDATQAAVAGISTGGINIMSATKGAIQVSYAKSGGTIEIVKGDTIDIPYGPLAKNITGRKVYFGVKQLLSDTAYVIAVKEITSSVTSFSTFTGTIPLTSAETGLTAGKYYAEIESRGSDGISTPATELKFVLKVVNQVIA